LRKSYLDPNTPVKFEYFKELSFLSPHIKFRSIMFENTDGKTVVSKREDISVDREATFEEIQAGGYFEEEPEHHVFVQESGAAQNVIYETASVQQIPEFSGSSHQISEVVQSEDEQQVVNPPKPQERKRKVSWDETEGDDNKFFAMSVACSLKRLTTVNNFKAKVEIFQVLEKIYTKQEMEGLRK
jgi:hypothetical protein